MVARVQGGVSDKCQWDGGCTGLLALILMTQVQRTAGDVDVTGQQLNWRKCAGLPLASE